jgi:hypothetical protein
MRYLISLLLVLIASTCLAGPWWLAAQKGSPPSNDFVISAVGGDASITIDKVSGATGATSYAWKYGTVSGSYGSYSTATLPHTHAGLTNGTTYYVKGKASNGGGFVESSEVSATPVAAIAGESHWDAHGSTSLVADDGTPWIDASNNANFSVSIGLTAYSAPYSLQLGDGAEHWQEDDSYFGHLGGAYHDYSLISGTIDFKWSTNIGANGNPWGATAYCIITPTSVTDIDTAISSGVVVWSNSGSYTAWQTELHSVGANTGEKRVWFIVDGTQVLIDSGRQAYFIFDNIKIPVAL